MSFFPFLYKIVSTVLFNFVLCLVLIKVNYISLGKKKKKTFTCILWSDKNKSELGAGMNLAAIPLLAQDCRATCKCFNQVRVNSLDKSEQHNTGNSFPVAVCSSPHGRANKRRALVHTCERYTAQQRIQPSNPSSIAGYAAINSSSFLELEMMGR